MAQPLGAPLDDSYKLISIEDFSGGWVTVTGALSLASNQSPDMLNVIPLPGRLRFRGGYENQVALPHPSDGAFPFYDSQGGKHQAVWAGGNLYDTISGTAVVIASAVYTAGSRIGRESINGILYWSCGQPNPVVLQFWDPVAATTGAVVSAGGTGVINPPATDFIFVYLNSLVALAPTWGAPTTGNVYQPNVFAWCATGDPTTWLAASSQAVGTANGGKLVYGAQFGVADAGVSPFRTIIIARNDVGIYSYSGAFPTLSESVINCPVGAVAGETFQYLPTNGAFGALVWLGTDGQIWQTNAINAVPISGNIMDFLVNAVAYALTANPSLVFSSGYNEEWQYYWLNVNGTFFVYRWQTQAWAKFQGWPNGPSFSTVGLTGSPAYFIASNAKDNPYLAEIALDNTPDNGVMPMVYYKTPYLHGGSKGIYKSFQWCTICAYDTGGIYSISAQGNKRIDGSYMQSDTSIVIAPGGSSGSPFILGVSILGGPDVLTLPLPPSGGEPVLIQTSFKCPVTPTLYIPTGKSETLKANAVQLTIAYAGGQPVFDIVGLEIRYIPVGYLPGAGLKYNPTAGAPNTFDPYVTPTG